MIPVRSFAQTQPVTADDCVSIALQNNPLIRVAVEDEKRALASYRVVQGNDSLLVNLGITPVFWDFESLSTPATPMEGGNNIGYYPLIGLTASYPLINPGSSAKEDASRKNYDIARIMGKKGKDDIILNVKQLYYGYIRANRAVAVREQMKKNYENRLSTIKILVRNGDRPVLEQSQAEVSLS
ncbi:MAG: TolC family protein, partial [Spirochaetota bacterium]